ncbi:MAG: zinc-dependent alcohol dehydrogenase [Myxococcaceae bacterium]
MVLRPGHRGGLLRPGRPAAAVRGAPLRRPGGRLKALTFNFSYLRLAAAKVLGAFSPRASLGSLGPLSYQEVPDPKLLGDDWVILQTRYCGICGSDVKQVFLEGSFDNPLTSLISFPHVLGHEHVGTVVEAGPAVKRVRKGQDVLCYPWLSCAVRGLELCARCREGRLSLCERFTEGSLAPGMHAGTCRDVSGGFAHYVPAHESMCFPVPEGTPLTTAALADPFTVCLHAVSKSPPLPGERVLVFGCGSLGALLVHVISRLYPGVEIVAVDRLAESGALVQSLGAQHFTTRSGRELVEYVGELTGASVRKPLNGMPFLHGGVDRIYDTVGSAATLETGVRVVKATGTIVLVGVSSPQRFEWTPLYFKEVTLIGSSGYGIESFGGRKLHGFDLFLELLGSGRIDPAPVITHKIALPNYQDAFVVAREKRKHGAVKILFDMSL